jgi:transposase
VHLAVDGAGLPLSVVVTGGTVNDSLAFTEVMDGIRVPRQHVGRPRTRPDRVLADKGYSSRAIRTWLRARGIAHTIPERADQRRNRLRRGNRGGRPCGFDRDLYARRNVVERAFNRLKQFKAVATRLDKLAAHYRAAVLIASLVLWTRQRSFSDRS